MRQPRLTAEDAATQRSRRKKPPGLGAERGVGGEGVSAWRSREPPGTHRSYLACRAEPEVDLSIRAH
jgi:hypothetical protein